jgi:hypothetical protein
MYPNLVLKVMRTQVHVPKTADPIRHNFRARRVAEERRRILVGSNSDDHLQELLRNCSH